jgi:hypothetical protein
MTCARSVRNLHLNLSPAAPTAAPGPQGSLAVFV